MTRQSTLIGSIRQRVAALQQLAATADANTAAWLEAAQRQHAAHLAQAARERSNAIDLATRTNATQAQLARTTAERLISVAEAEGASKRKQGQDAYGAAAAKAAAIAAEVATTAALTAAPWTDPCWQQWATSTAAAVFPATRIGVLSERGPWGTLDLPALLPFPAERPLVIIAQGAGKGRAVTAIQALLFRLAATIPPGKLRFTFIDPIGLGQNVAAFMQLKDHDPDLVTDRAWTETRDIERHLLALTEHMETVIQTYLRNMHATIEQHNSMAGEVQEPYRVLTVFDFPTNFSEGAANRLVSIANNGPRCGVCTVVLVDEDKPRPHGFTLDDLTRNATILRWDDEKAEFRWDDNNHAFGACELTLDAPPSDTLLNATLKVVGQAAVRAKTVRVPFRRVAPPKELWWEGTTTNEMKIALGPRDATNLQYLTLGSNAVHALLVGQTGSGKSTLLHTLITNAALTYSPDELELYLIDFKEGVEFQTYALRRLPHARVIAIESEREFGLSVLKGLVAKIEERGRKFTTAALTHGKVSEIGAYREKTADPMPRILLVIDEFQRFFEESDSIAAQAAQALDHLARQGRSFGIHMLLASQSLRGAFGASGLPAGTLSQMGARIALRCSDADSRMILAEDNGAARGLTRAGAAMYNDKNGLVEGNEKFQVAWLPDDERDDYLEAITGLDQIRRTQPRERTVVFQGNARAKIENNDSVAALLSAGRWANRSNERTIWLGEPVAIKQPTTVVLTRRSGANLLIVGQDEDAAMGVTSMAMTNLALQGDPDQAQFLVLDFSSPDGANAGCLALLQAALPHRVEVGGRRELPSLIEGLHRDIQQRLDRGTPVDPSIYLILFGLHRARDLRRDDSPLGSYALGSASTPAPPSPAKLLPAILREGAELGIHAVVWCDTFTNLERTLDRRVLREFDLRVAFQMAEKDSMALIDAKYAGQLGPNRALLYSEERSSIEKFRPYGVPDLVWFEQLQHNLALRFSAGQEDGAAQPVSSSTAFGA